MDTTLSSRKKYESNDLTVLLDDCEAVLQLVRAGLKKGEREYVTIYPQVCKMLEKLHKKHPIDTVILEPVPESLDDNEARATVDMVLDCLAQIYRESHKIDNAMYQAFHRASVNFPILRLVQFSNMIGYGVNFEFYKRNRINIPARASFKKRIS